MNIDRKHGSFLESIEPNPAGEALAAVFGGNLRRLRTRRGYSLERLAHLSGVSRAMLGQIETARSVPTLTVIWKIATALDVPPAVLMTPAETARVVLYPIAQARRLHSSEGRFVERALGPDLAGNQVGFYELRLAPGHVESVAALPPGSRIRLLVSSGKIEVDTHAHIFVLEVGDVILFDADAPYALQNIGQDDAVLYQVVTASRALFVDSDSHEAL